MRPRLILPLLGPVLVFFLLGTPAPHPDGDRQSTHILHPDYPPPAHTGGFGEPTCVECHTEPESPSGSLDLLGLPVTSSPGGRTKIGVRLLHTGMERAGFQLSVRHADSTQAGTLTAATDREAIREEGGILYASHTWAGSFAQRDTAEWTVLWDPPESGKTVWIHLVANAGNGDNSPLGDTIYARFWVVPGR
jgi:hypothetical protein